MTIVTHACAILGHDVDNFLKGSWSDTILQLVEKHAWNSMLHHLSSVGRSRHDNYGNTIEAGIALQRD